MKTVKYILLFILFSFLSIGSTFATTCDQIFENNFVRYNYSYGFFDNITNTKAGAQDLYLNTWSIDYVNPQYLDKGITYANGSYWDWTQNIKDLNYKIVVGTNNILMLKTKANDWRIAQHPSSRTTSKTTDFDFMISYTIDYDFSNNYPDASDDLSHTECIYYSVTWCGDGVVDSGFGEICDPNDPSKAGWGTGGCNPVCKPLVAPTCDSLTVNPSSGEAPVNSNVSCSGTNVDYYTIDCGNSTTINNQSGTCNFTNPGTYNVICSLNDDNITSAACTKQVTITPAPYCGDGTKDAGETCDYNDPAEEGFGDGGCNTMCEPILLPATCDSLVATLDIGNASFTSSFLCNGTKATSYKIEIKNNSGALIKTINNQTGTYLFDQAGVFTSTCYVNDTITSSACNDTITVGDGDTTPGFGTVSCDSLTATPSVGEAPLDSSVVCSGINVTKFKIDCGNGQEYTKIGTGTGAESFSETCNYVSAGEYTPKCYVDDTITNSSCEKSVTVENPPVSTCDQIFENNFVRYDQSYHFYDVYNNSANQNIYLTKYFVDYINPEYLDQGGAFDWTPEIIASGYAIEANSSMKFIKTGLPNWRIQKHPLTRTTSTQTDFDFMIEYTVDYDFSNNYPDASDDFSHSECQYFSVTWCGDGTLDSAYETCDPNDISEQGWGNDGCDAMCEPKNIDPEAICDNLTVIPDSGNAPLNVTATCTGTNATSYKITCGNGAILNASTGECNYPSIGTYEVSCIVNDTITSSSCKKSVTVNRTPPAPTIDIEKSDFNTSDIDGIIGNDTQKVNSGDKAVFKIRVTNYTEEELKDFVLTDIVEANCAGSVTMPSTIPSTFSNFVIGGAGDHTDAYLEEDEYFEYTCEKLNTLSDYTNIATVDAKGRVSNIAVNASDDTEVLVETVVPGSCDTMTATPNNGEAPLDSTIVCSGTNVSAFKIDCDNGQIFTIPGVNSGVETFSKVCNYGSANTYTPKCYVDNVTNTSCTKTVTVNTVTPVPNITIDKIDANVADIDGSIGNDTQKVNSGDKAVFKIKVTNNGAEDLENIILLDAISPYCAGSVAMPSTIPSTFGNFLIGGSGDNGNSYLEPGEYFSYTCEKANTTFNYTNVATVNANGKTSNISVTSTDDTEVIVEIVDVSSCNNLSASPLNGYNSLDSTVTCEGTKVDKFEIDCGNGQIFTEVGSSSGIESFTEICNYVGIGSYTPKCIINDTITNSSCEEVVSVTGGGGTGPVCYRIEVETKTSTSTGLTTPVTCIGNNKVKSFKLDCGNGDILFGNADSNYEYTGICDFETTDKTLFTPKCYVSGIANKTDPNYSGWKTSYACKTKVTLGGDSYCGDGVIQRPNTNGEYEECERALDEYGNIGEFPDFCLSTCEIKEGPGDNPTTLPGVITVPNEGEIVFEPGMDIIIGDGMNPFKEVFQAPYVKNNSSYDLYFEKLCVIKKSGTTLNGNNKYCKTLTSILYPGMVVEFGSYPNYVGDITVLPATESYGDNELVITIQDDGILYDDAYFAARFNVRVSKPSIATVGGGTSYVSDTSNISDVSSVADGYVDDIYINQNRNFVGVGVSDGGISSYSTDVTDATSVTYISNDLNDFDYNSGATIGIPNADTTSDFAEFTSYNGIDNVYIIRNKSFEIDSDLFSTLIGPRTYIVENGDLIINSDIIYSENIAFIVKGGDIIVNKDVENITGTFVTIEAGAVGGNIKGDGNETSTILHVNGSLYGNTNDLISSRTYIRDNTSGQIDVGTIVSFGSSLFRQPAPLVGEFVEEYLDQVKVAQ